MTTEVLVLLLAFQVKHLIADYYLQFPYMYENKGKPIGWLKPLIDHSLVHAGLSILIVAIYGTITLPNVEPAYSYALIICVFLFDFVTHFITDRWKATRKGGPDTSGFWKNLGIDQMIHHTVGILIVWYMTIGVQYGL